MTALVDLFPPAPTEGPIGHMRRLSVRNDYNDWRSLVRASGVNPSLNALWKNNSMLCNAHGAKRGGLVKLTDLAALLK